MIYDLAPGLRHGVFRVRRTNVHLLRDPAHRPDSKERKDDADRPEVIRGLPRDLQYGKVTQRYREAIEVIGRLLDDYVAEKKMPTRETVEQELSHVLRAVPDVNYSDVFPGLVAHHGRQPRENRRSLESIVQKFTSAVASRISRGQVLQGIVQLTKAVRTTEASTVDKHLAPLTRQFTEIERSIKQLDTDLAAWTQQQTTEFAACVHGSFSFIQQWRDDLNRLVADRSTISAEEVRQLASDSYVRTLSDKLGQFEAARGSVLRRDGEGANRHWGVIDNERLWGSIRDDIVRASVEGSGDITLVNNQNRLLSGRLNEIQTLVRAVKALLEGHRVTGVGAGGNDRRFGEVQFAQIRTNIRTAVRAATEAVSWRASMISDEKKADDPSSVGRRVPGVDPWLSFRPEELELNRQITQALSEIGQAAERSDTQVGYLLNAALTLINASDKLLNGNGQATRSVELMQQFDRVLGPHTKAILTLSDSVNDTLTAVTEVSNRSARRFMGILDQTLRVMLDFYTRFLTHAQALPMTNAKTILLQNLQTEFTNATSAWRDTIVHLSDAKGAKRPDTANVVWGSVPADQATWAAQFNQALSDFQAPALAALETTKQEAKALTAMQNTLQEWQQLVYGEAFDMAHPTRDLNLTTLAATYAVLLHRVRTRIRDIGSHLVQTSRVLAARSPGAVATSLEELANQQAACYEHLARNLTALQTYAQAVDDSVPVGAERDMDHVLAYLNRMIIRSDPHGHGQTFTRLRQAKRTLVNLRAVIAVASAGLKQFLASRSDYNDSERRSRNDIRATLQASEEKDMDVLDADEAHEAQDGRQRAVSTKAALAAERARLEEDTAELANRLHEQMETSGLSIPHYVGHLLDIATESDERKEGHIGALIGVWETKHGKALAAIRDVETALEKRSRELHQAIHTAGTRWSRTYPMELIDGLLDAWRVTFADMTAMRTDTEDPLYQQAKDFETKVSGLMRDYADKLQQAEELLRDDNIDAKQREREQLSLVGTRTRFSQMASAQEGVEATIRKWDHDRGVQSRFVAKRFRQFVAFGDLLSTVLPEVPARNFSDLVQTVFSIDPFVDDGPFDSLAQYLGAATKKIVASVGQTYTALRALVRRWDALNNPPMGPANLTMLAHLAEIMDQQTTNATQGLEALEKAQAQAQQTFRLKPRGARVVPESNGIARSVERLSKRMTTLLNRGTETLREKYNAQKKLSIDTDELPITANSVEPQLLMMQAMGQFATDNDQYRRMIYGVSTRMHQFLRFIELVAGTIPKPLDNLLSSVFMTAENMFGGETPPVHTDGHAPQSLDKFISLFYSAISNINPTDLELVRARRAPFTGAKGSHTRGARAARKQKKAQKTALVPVTPSRKRPSEEKKVRVAPVAPPLEPEVDEFLEAIRDATPSLLEDEVKRQTQQRLARTHARQKAGEPVQPKDLVVGETSADRRLAISTLAHIFDGVRREIDEAEARGREAPIVEVKPVETSEVTIEDALPEALEYTADNDEERKSEISSDASDLETTPDGPTEAAPPSALEYKVSGRREQLLKARKEEAVEKSLRHARLSKKQRLREETPEVVSTPVEPATRVRPSFPVPPGMRQDPTNPSMEFLTPADRQRLKQAARDETRKARVEQLRRDKEAKRLGTPAAVERKADLNAPIEDAPDLSKTIADETQKQREAALFGALRIQKQRYIALQDIVRRIKEAEAGVAAAQNAIKAADTWLGELPKERKVRRQAAKQAFDRLQQVQHLIATSNELDIAQGAAANISAALAAQQAADYVYDLNPLHDQVHLVRDKAQIRLKKSQKQLKDLRTSAAQAFERFRVADLNVQAARQAMGGTTWQSSAPFEDAAPRDMDADVATSPRMDLPELEPAAPDVEAALSPETKQREEKTPEEPMDADRGESAEQRDRQIRDAEDAEDEEVSDLTRQTSQLMLAFRLSIMNAQKLLLDARTFNIGMQTILTPTGARCILRAWTFLQNSAPKVFGSHVRSLAQMIFCSDESLLLAFADLCANIYEDKDIRRPTRNAKDKDYFNRMADEARTIANHILDSTRLNPVVKGPYALNNKGAFAWIFQTPLYPRNE